MIFKKEFKETYAILEGKKELHPLFDELKQFVEKEFDIKVFSVFLDTEESRSARNFLLEKGYKKRLIFNVASNKEREKMQNAVPYSDDKVSDVIIMRNDENKQKIIIDKLYDLNKKYNVSLPENKKEIWVDYFYFFALDYVWLSVQKQKHKIKKIINSYRNKANIWKLSIMGPGLVVFYEKDKDVKTNLDNGITKEIKDNIFSIFKENDKLNILEYVYHDEYISFDSKENLDKNYHGSLYLYFR